jgi:hypothetical protein
MLKFSNFFVTSRFSNFCVKLPVFELFQIRGHRQAMDELRATNLSLSERLDSLHRSLSLSPAHGINQVSILVQEDFHAGNN